MARKKANNAVNDLFSNMGFGESQDEQEIPETPDTAPEPITAAPEPATTIAKTEKKPRSKRKSYQIWVPEDEYATWKAYQQAAAALPKREDLGFTAIREYIKRHPLADDELAIYNAILKRDGITE